MKTCVLCKIEQPLGNFNKRALSKDGLQTVCRKCNRARSKQYYLNNHDKHRKAVQENNKAYKKRNRDFLVEYLGNHPCVDCGNTDIRVLEFDHLPGTEKINGVARVASSGASLNTLQKEVEKCEVRCRNCHMIKTYERIGGSWHDHYLDVITMPS